MVLCRLSQSATHNQNQNSSMKTTTTPELQATQQALISFALEVLDAIECEQNVGWNSDQPFVCPENAFAEITRFAGAFLIRNQSSKLLTPTEPVRVLRDQYHRSGLLGTLDKYGVSEPQATALRRFEFNQAHDDAVYIWCANGLYWVGRVEFERADNRRFRTHYATHDNGFTSYNLAELYAKRLLAEAKQEAVK